MSISRSWLHKQTRLFTHVTSSIFPKTRILRKLYHFVVAFLQNQGFFTFALFLFRTFETKSFRTVPRQSTQIIRRNTGRPENRRYLNRGYTATGVAKKKWTYNSRDSLMVTHSTTNPPIWGLCMAERTGCPILLSLWSYVTGFSLKQYMRL